jgi:hypothetical protein
MAEFLFDRDDVTVITLRVPKRLWDSWEYRHKHFGQAIHALREHCVEVMAHRLLVQGSWKDLPDPFFKGPA